MRWTAPRPSRAICDDVAVEGTTSREPQIADITTIGLDLAKNVFQIHGIDATGRELIRRQLRRSEVLKFFGSLPPCLVGMEACATAHHWAREITKLGPSCRRRPSGVDRTPST
jgi:hypothetical protein